MTDTATRNHGPSPEQKTFIKTSVQEDIGRICKAWDKAMEETGVYSVTQGTGVGAGDDAVEIKFRSTAAERWIADTKPVLALVLKLGDRAWLGAFDPPRLTDALCRSAVDLVDLWPVNVEKLLKRIERLASIAGKHWPETPKKGTVVDGVKVGAATKPLERCVECDDLILATADDPLARIDGKAYHRKPCYGTVWARNKRRSA